MKHEAAIQALKAALTERYGEKLDRVIVFGSAARDEADAYSDIDVMIVLDSGKDSVHWREESEVHALAFEIELQFDAVFDVKLVERSMLNGLFGHTPFMENVLREGVVV